MKNLHVAVVAVACGILITLLTGLVPSTPLGLIGTASYGYPLGWIARRAVSPQYDPWHMRPVNLVFDVVFWFVVAAIVMFLSKHSKSSKGQARRRV